MSLTILAAFGLTELQSLLHQVRASVRAALPRAAIVLVPALLAAALVYYPFLGPLETSYMRRANENDRLCAFAITRSKELATNLRKPSPSAADLMERARLQNVLHHYTDAYQTLGGTALLLDYQGALLYVDYLIQLGLYEQADQVLQRWVNRSEEQPPFVRELRCPIREAATAILVNRRDLVSQGRFTCLDSDERKRFTR